MSDTTSTIPGTVLITFANLFGAHVTVTDTHQRDSWRWAWSCRGCLDGGQAISLDSARDRANGHAATCRALPPTPATTA